ncbi:hypothetical protein K1719_017639 [Acacia pycnantha]|nr:hypothetical protein K1719_017639 [Acacia pycnantha]
MSQTLIHHWLHNEDKEVAEILYITFLCYLTLHFLQSLPLYYSLHIPFFLHSLSYLVLVRVLRPKGKKRKRLNWAVVKEAAYFFGRGVGSDDSLKGALLRRETWWHPLKTA